MKNRGNLYYKPKSIEVTAFRCYVETTENGKAFITMVRLLSTCDYTPAIIYVPSELKPYVSRMFCLRFDSAQVLTDFHIPCDDSKHLAYIKIVAGEDIDTGEEIVRTVTCKYKDVDWRDEPEWLKNIESPDDHTSDDWIVTEEASAK